MSRTDIEHFGRGVELYVALWILCLQNTHKKLCINNIKLLYLCLSLVKEGRLVNMFDVLIVQCCDLR